MVPGRGNPFSSKNQNVQLNNITNLRGDTQSRPSRGGTQLKFRIENQMKN